MNIDDSDKKKHINIGSNPVSANLPMLYDPVVDAGRARALYIKKDHFPMSKAFLDNFDTCVVVLDDHLNVLMMNQSAEKSMKVDLSHVKKIDYLTLRKEQHNSKLREDLQEVINHVKTLSTKEIKFFAPDDTVYYMDFTYVPVVNDRGRVENILVFSKNVTEKVSQQVIQDDIDKRIQSLLAEVNLKEQVIEHLQEQLENRYQFQNIIGQNKRMQELYQLIERLSATDATVLITGETGVGKELFAKAIHYSSARSKGALISVNCAALPETLLESELFGHVKGSFTGAVRDKKGKFELAHQGTLFLDEVGEMSLTTQVKLLRVLQEREIERIGDERKINVDIRIVCATNRDLTKMVEEGTFRKDLFYRIGVINLNVPSLRDRKDDIPMLSQFFITKYNQKFGFKKKGFSPNALRDLLLYNWPGNVRELEAVVEKSMILSNSDFIEQVEFADNMEKRSNERFEHLGLAGNSIASSIGKSNAEYTSMANSRGNPDFSLPENVEKYDDFVRYAEQLERDYFLAVFAKCKGRVNQIAEVTGLNRRTIANKIQKFQIDKKQMK